MRAPLILLALGMLGGADPASAFVVTAAAETDPVPNSGDAADDAAIWIHPTDPALSLVIGTDKQGGLAVYDLAGTELQYLPDGQMNNVDLRYNFPLDGELVTLVAAGNRAGDTIEIYKVLTDERRLESVNARTIEIGIGEAYGFCMYRSMQTDTYYCIVNDKAGRVEQWELFASGALVDAVLVRSFDAGSQTEGCVADDELGHLYIGEENRGIWKYGAEPDAGEARTMVDETGGTGNLVADVEGLTLYYASDGEGYLIASSQGNDSFVVYERSGDNAHLDTFQIGAGIVDGVSGTDGIDVTNVNLGADFPFGLFVVQDGSNSGGNQNYKLVPWNWIANAASNPLSIDLTFDPREAGGVPHPVSLGAVRAVATADGEIRLAWEVHDGSFVGFVIERAGGIAAGDGAFLPLNRNDLVPGEGPWVYTDPQVAPGHTYTYRVVAVLPDGDTETSGAVVVTASATAPLAPLLAATPNPSRGEVVLRFELPAGGPAELSIYDPNGRLVRRLLRGVERAAGVHAALWDTRDQRGAAVASGVYLARLVWPGGVETRSVTLLR